MDVFSQKHRSLTYVAMAKGQKQTMMVRVSTNIMMGGIQHRVDARPHPGDPLYEAKRSVHHAFVARRFDELGQAVWHPEDHHCQLYRDQDFSRMILLQNQRGARLLFILLALLSEPKVRQEGLPMESAQGAL